MNIQVRVASAQALKELQALEVQSVATARGVRGMGVAAGGGLNAMAKWGSQVQWMGRQLMYNFAIPIGLAGGLATKFALDNEAAMVRVTKVYGDNSPVFNRLSQTEIPALQKAFEALSNEFGVNQAEVINVAGDWAAAGASGIALAKATKLTMETMVLGEMDAAEATRDLIAIQSQYGFNTAQLAKTIDILNMSENQTGASMQDLITGMSRTAGSARTAGIDVEHLAAMMSALVPSAGSAATAGNGLKTIITRLLTPTQAATDLMEQMGIQVDKTSWLNLNGTQRLEEMAKAYKNLSNVQQIQVAKNVASMYQINRFSVLMDALNNKNSYYYKSLKSTADRTEIFKQRVKELNQVLDSNPQKMQQIGVILQNSMADIIQPLIPMIVFLGQELARLGNAFSNLDPRIQKIILFIGAFIIAFAVMTKMVGASAGLIAFLGKAFLGLGTLMGGVVSVITGPFVAAWSLLAGVLSAVGGAALSVMGAIVGYIVTGFATIIGATVTFATEMAAAALWGPLGVAVEAAWTGVLSVFATAIPAALSLFGAWIADMWTMFAVWRASMLTAMTAWVGKIGVLFTLLGSFIAEGMASLWAWLTIPGMISGRILAIWGAMTAAMSRIWLATQAVMYRAWIALQFSIEKAFAALQFSLAAIQTAGSKAIVLVWAGMQAAWRTVVVNMQLLWFVAWSTMRLAPVKALASFKNLIMLIPEALAAIGPAILAVITSPWTIAVAAVLGIVYVFRDKLLAAWKAILGSLGAPVRQALSNIGGWFTDLGNLIINVWWALPTSVRNAMVAVLNVIKQAALQIYEWMSYINPFAHHSPSLVEQVTAGMDVIQAQYKRVANIGKPFANAASDLAKFKSMIPQGSEFSSDRADVAKNIPRALPLFDKLVGRIRSLTKVMDDQKKAVDAQQKVVDSWQNKLDQANNVLDRQQNKLDKLQKTLQGLQDQYDAAQTSMQNFADAPIEGMQAFNDQIFANQQAQKQLQLQMDQWEQANGSIDDMRDKLAKLNGDIETMTGRAETLRQGGAGSDVLKPIEDQINAMKAQAQAVNQAVQNSPIDAMQKQLDDLQKEGEMLQLQYDIKYDPLTRQIEQLANAQKELSYDDIVKGITAQQAVMAQLTPQIDTQTAAVAAQQTKVDNLTAARDVLSNTLDREKKKLDKLNDSYNKTKDLISDITSALHDMGSAAQQAAEAQKKNKDATKSGKGSGAGGGLTDFQKAAGANFPDVGGKAKIGREGGLQDQSDLINQFTQDTVDDMNKVFGDMDMLGPFKKQFSKVWSWLQTNIGPIMKQLGTGIDASTQGIGAGLGAVLHSQFAQGVQTGFSAFVDFGATIAKWAGSLWNLIGPDIIDIGKKFTKFGQDLWSQVGPELAKFGPVFSQLGNAISNVWKVAKPLVAIFGGTLLFAIKLLISTISGVLGPILDWLVAIIKDAVKIIVGVFEIIIGILSGDWSMAWQGVVDIVGGALDAVWETIKGAAKLIWGAVKGIVKGIIGFFEWLYDELVGHSIVPDLVNAIIHWFHVLFDTLITVAKAVYAGLIAAWSVLVTIAQWMWDNVLKPIWDIFVSLWDNFIGPALGAWWEAMKLEWDGLKAAGQWVWDNVLKPVYDFFVSAWKDYVKPALAAWWDAIKKEWDGLKKAGQWVWDNMLQPVWSMVDGLWKNYVKPALGAWWGNVKAEWDALKGAGQWIWTNMLDPVLTQVKNGWTSVKGELDDWWNRIKTAWNNVTNAGGWIKTNVMDPVVQAFKDGWNTVKDWFTNNGDTILSPIKSVVKGIVGAINWIIKGINKLDSLPGVNISIGELQLPDGFAAGGIPRRRVGSGFMTQGARAIVGEGKPNYPEFVIPTDPTYRSRALGLLGQAAKKLGADRNGRGAWGDYAAPNQGQIIADQIGLFAAGGILGGIGDVLGDVGGAVKSGLGKIGDAALNVAQDAFAETMKPFIGLAHKAADSIDWSTGKDAANGAIDVVSKWLAGANAAYNGAVKQAATDSHRGKLQKGLDFARSQAGKPYKMVYDAVGPDYYDCSGFMSAVTRKILGQDPHAPRIGTTAGFPWPMFGPVQVNGANDGFVIGSTPHWSGGSSTGHMAGTLLGVMIEANGDQGVVIGHRGAFDPHFTEHAQLQLRNGGIALAKYGGVTAQIAEAGHDEAVIPLPRGWRTDAFRGTDSKGDTTIHFHGNLEFPNIKSGDDAKTFISNLEDLAG